LSARTQQYTVSMAGMFALVGAVILYLFSASFHPEGITSFVLMTFLLIIGVVLAYILVGVRFEFSYDLKRLTTDAIAATVTFVSIYFVNKAVPINYGLSPIGETAFGMLAGVTEEWFFRLFLCAWIYKLTGKAWLAIPISSIIWAWFHLYRYGANLDLIWLVFLAGLPLGFFTLYFRSADGSTFGHVIVNFLSG
jgi:hypothetical protein